MSLSTVPTDGELRELLGGDEVVELSRRPYRYATSAALDELQVRLRDGTELSLILKELARERLIGDARITKPDFTYEPERELATYRDVLAPAGIGPRFYGTGEGQWFVIEKVPGVELWQVGELEIWEGVAGWLAGFHARFANRVDAVRGANPYLIEHTEAWFCDWCDRARAALAGAGDPRAPELVRALSGYGEVAAALASLPRHFVHGEFYPSNVLVRPRPLRVCPVDWEMAAIGPAAMDLAALVGGWGDAERERLIDAYARAGTRLPHGDVERCRLHFALQWLGWSREWRPPREHAHDWVGEALTLVRSLGLA
ncbi:MAG TPA: aminoglycoside phosphotransferase family protein [Thermoleophilaceae bacterium]